MKSSKLYVTVILLFMGFSIYAQKVHYKDNYYTIVKSKIFHRGHDVYGKLTSGARDTIHLIAKELYTERGKLKEKYKNVPRRERYKLPEGFWKEKAPTPSNDAAVAVKATPEENTTEAKATNIVQQINPTEKVTAVAANEISNNMTKKVVEEKEKETEKILSSNENDKKVTKEKSDTKLTVNADLKKEEEVEKREQKKEKEEKKEALEEKITQQKEDKKNAIARLAVEKAASEQSQREKEQQQREDKKNAIAKLENEKVAREQAQKKKEQEELEDEREKAARKKEKALKKKEKEEKEREREQQKLEKEKKRKEKELKQKEKAISNHKSAQKKLEKAEKKYKKLKEKGELSPIEEAEWLEKIEKLKEKVTKREKQLRK